MLCIIQAIKKSHQHTTMSSWRSLEFINWKETSNLIKIISACRCRTSLNRRLSCAQLLEMLAEKCANKAVVCSVAPSTINHPSAPQNGSIIRSSTIKKERITFARVIDKQKARNRRKKFMFSRESYLPQLL